MLYLKSMMPDGETTVVSPIGDSFVFHTEESSEFRKLADSGKIDEKQNMAIISDHVGESEWIALDRFMDHYVVHENGDTMQVLKRNQRPCLGGGHLYESRELSSQDPVYYTSN